MEKDNQSIYDMVNNVVQVVFNTHYNYIKDPELRQDMYQIGYLKAYELLNNGNYDPTMSLRNFLYTGIRNEMHNTLYHLNKVTIVNLEVLDKYDNIVGFHETGDYDVDLEFIKSKIYKYNKFGSYYEGVVNYLIDLGILDCKKLTDNPEDRKPELFEGLKSLILWELFEKEAEYE